MSLVFEKKYSILERLSNTLKYGELMIGDIGGALKTEAEILIGDHVFNLS